MSRSIAPGVLVLGSNKLEALWDRVAAELDQTRLDPLEQEVILAPGNGIKDWLHMRRATQQGVCAATSVESPSRFLWRMYAEVLGRANVPPVSPLDREPLTWRLMRLLETLEQERGEARDASIYAPLRAFLHDGDPERRLQLACRLAERYEQYQIYRGDWLGKWRDNYDVLIDAECNIAGMEPDQRWQAALWREILEDIGAPPEQSGESGRADVHRRFVHAVTRSGPHARLPRRIVLFGVSTLPGQMLAALEALSHQCLVIIAVLNPCRFHWGDLIEGRERLRPGRRNLRGGIDLRELPLETLHQHGNPLLAAWGRQGRDFLGLLDELEERHTRLRRVEAFDLRDPVSLLEQVQAAIRDMEPLPQGQPLCVPADDASIVFHVAHSAGREIEILHDQLLALFERHAKDGKSTLAPRDVVVMMPDVERFAPAIRAIFGQYDRHDARHIPFQILDQGATGDTLVTALAWLLQLSDSRCRLSELRELLDVPAVARRFGFDAAGLARIGQWMDDAGVRWGLDAAHRNALKLGASGDIGTLSFGLDRMLLGYASGDGAPFDGIEPFADPAGLGAALVGQLTALASALRIWRERLALAYRPAQWGELAAELLDVFFDPDDAQDRFVLVAVKSALARWIETCAQARFDEVVPAKVVRKAWLEEIDADERATPGFQSGSVTFCALTPMRAIPFEVVCLIGMNDGEFPRSTSTPDFDLLALPKQRRPGDRARRDDDRYLMLEALLSARRTLYISWSGHSVRDNTEQPPSTLVSQLRDYLKTGWSAACVERRTIVHPLQPFSRRYFEPGALFTYADEWRDVHGPHELPAAGGVMSLPDERAAMLTLSTLQAFVRNPVKQFYRRRLNVSFERKEPGTEDNERFLLKALDAYAVRETLALHALAEPLRAGSDRATQLRALAGRLARAGELPLGGFGPLVEAELVDAVLPMLCVWDEEAQRWPLAQTSKLALRFEGSAGNCVDDWLDGVRERTGEGHGGQRRFSLRPTHLLEKRQDKKQDRPAIAREKLLAEYLVQLTANACGVAVSCVVIGSDAMLVFPAMAQSEACMQLDAWLTAYRAGMRYPLPFAHKTALAMATHGASAAQEKYEGKRFEGESVEPALKRTFADFAGLRAHVTPDATTFGDYVEAHFKPMSDYLDTLAVTPHAQ
jgi:exodeoxyribonuclease V gamma subunit